MGVTGAAIATVCGQIISFFVLLADSMRGANIRLRIRNVRLNGHYLLEIINGGIPTLFRQGLAAVATRTGQDHNLYLIPTGNADPKP